MISDTHIHTRFSTDSGEEPENHIKRAIQLGMKELCFTDHYDMDFPDGLFMFDVDDYFKELGALKEKYKDEIIIHIGVELGLKPDLSDRLEKFVAQYPFERVIGSIHLVDGKDPYERELFEMPDASMYRRYFETCLECVRACSCFDSFGHIDYIVRYGYEKDRAYSYMKYADLIDEILDLLIKKDIALEINTAGRRKGLAFVHPYPDILRRYRQMGGRALSVGSDAHSSSNLGYGLKNMTGYLESFGFKESDIIGYR